MSEQTTLIDIEQEAMARRDELQALVITDQESYDRVASKLPTISGWIKNAEAFFKSMKDPARTALQKIIDNEKTVIEPVKQQLSIAKSALVQWDAEQERLRRERQRQLDAEAHQRAVEAQIAQATDLEAQGVDNTTVAAVLDAPVQVTELVRADPTYARSSAVVMRDNWSCQVDDLFKLVQHVAKDKSKIGLLMPNQVALNQMAKALKESMQIPGIRAVNNRIAATGRSR